MEMQMAEEKQNKMNVGDVLAKDKPKPEEKKSSAKTSASKKKHKHTHIESHFNEKGESTGHTVRHTPMDGGPEVSYAAPDLDAVHDGLEEHLGDENADESAAGGQGAQPSPQAPPQQMAQPQPQAV
jgi:hypothetical protein